MWHVQNVTNMQRKKNPEIYQHQMYMMRLSCLRYLITPFNLKNKVIYLALQRKRQCKEVRETYGGL